jgi:ABC-type sugar transport system ATPase subunit
MEKRARAMLAAIDAPIDVRRLVGELTVAEQQMVQIAAAVGSGARVIIFDEPTSSLSQHETEHFLRAARSPEGARRHLRVRVAPDAGDLPPVRHHHGAARRPPRRHQADRGDRRGALVQLMIGPPARGVPAGRDDHDGGGEVLRVADLASPRKFADISFSVHAGEVVGIAGLVGAGRTDIAHALFGLDPGGDGRVEVAGIPLGLRSPAEAMRAGVGFVPEDRKRHGLVLSLRALENVTLPTLRSLARAGWLRGGAERELAADAFARLRVRTPDLGAVTAGLSGGNQQKLVLAKWLAARCRVLILDEPTRGVDVGAKAEIHALIGRLAAEGTGILLISSELPELVALSTRILVLRDGQLVGALERDQADQESLLRMMAGLAPDGPRLRA